MRVPVDGIDQQFSGLLFLVHVHIDIQQPSDDRILQAIVIEVHFLARFLQQFERDLPRLGKLFQFLSNQLSGITTQRFHHFLVSENFRQRLPGLILFVVAHIKHGDHDFASQPLRLLLHVLANGVPQKFFFISPFNALEDTVKHRSDFSVAIIGSDGIEPVPGI